VNTRTKKFLSYYRPYLGLLFADISCAFIVSVITLFIPLITRYITGTILAGNMSSALHKIYVIGAAMLVFVVIQTVCSIFTDAQGHALGARMESDMRGELFEHYLKMSFCFYDEQSTGQLMTRISNDLLSLTELYHHGPEDITVSLLKFVGTFIILININVRLTLIIFLFMPFMVVYVIYSSKRVYVALRKSKDRVGDINAQLEDTLSGIRVVKSYTNEEAEKKKFAFANDRFFKSRKAGYQSEAYCYTVLEMFSQLITVAVIIFGGAAIAYASLNLSDLLTYLMCVAILIDPIQKLVNFVRLYQEGMTAFDRFMEMMEIGPEIQDAADAVELKDVRGNITFRDVSFRYKNNYDYVLKNISLNIKAGDYIALVGSSGVGKTTLCSLIPRFYEVSRGEILFDGVNIKDVSLNSLRHNVGVVQQEVYLFSGTIADNIRYGKLDAGRDEIIEAAKKANAHKFIMALPQGYDTDIGQHGVKLSGGQRQRLSIARVFLKNPPVLILDEATSSLDNETEKAVKESLEKLIASRTTLVIAHRLSTVRNAKRIIVLSENGIDEEGTHEELIKRNSIYANLYNTQLEL
jgi:ATP-binding cassette subfamily B protein